MLDNVKDCGYNEPTPIQQACLPAILGDHELLATAQTGTGKTGAYLIPIISRLMGKHNQLCAPRPGKGDIPEGTLVRAEPLVVIIAPTRELALQIYDHTRRLCYRSMLRPVCVFGGGKMGGEWGQVNQLQKGCDILIGTFGRICHMADDPRVLSFRRMK
jgi:ATP-dependent RNA helicase DDX3X